MANKRPVARTQPTTGSWQRDMAATTQSAAASCRVRSADRGGKRHTPTGGARRGGAWHAAGQLAARWVETWLNITREGRGACSVVVLEVSCRSQTRQTQQLGGVWANSTKFSYDDTEGPSRGVQDSVATFPLPPVVLKACPRVSHSSHHPRSPRPRSPRSCCTVVGFGKRRTLAGWPWLRLLPRRRPINGIGIGAGTRPLLFRPNESHPSSAKSTPRYLAAGAFSPPQIRNSRVHQQFRLIQRAKQQRAWKWHHAQIFLGGKRRQTLTRL